MTPSQSIDKAAKEYGKNKWSFDHEDLLKRLRVSGSADDFKAGADYVLSHPELMREEILEFVSWLDSNKITLDYREQKDHTDDELFTLYIEDKKEKQ